MDKDGGNRVQFIERIYNKPSGLKATIGEKRVSAGRGNREPKIMFPRIYYSIPPPSSPLLFLFSRLPGGKRPLGRREGGEERRGEGGGGRERSNKANDKHDNCDESQERGVPTNVEKAN